MTRTPVISLGAGVQSTVLTLMAAEGLLAEKPTLAIFADTQQEPLGVYRHLDWLEAQVAGRIEIARVSAGDLLEEALERKFNPIPLYLRNDKGKASAGRRQCTKEFKLYPIRHELRRRGFSEKQPVSMLLGISTDEVQRMKPTGLKWVTNHWPLIDAGMNRQDCKTWFSDRHPGRDLAKSACVFCPYKREREWSQMRKGDILSWVRAVVADEAMRNAGNGREQFVSASLVPLRDLRDDEDLGQLNLDDECEGMCGV